MSNTLKNTQLGLRIYHWASIIIGVSISLCMVLGLGVGIFASVAENDPDAPPAWFWTLFIAIFGLMFFFSIGLSVAGLMTIKKQSKWVWILQVVLVSFGFGSMLTIVPCILLMIGLVSKETREYYGI